MERDVLLTQEGYEKLQEELAQLSTDKRREVADRIRIAREFGDISENSEFDDAKNEQMLLEKQIAKLEERLRSARIIDPSDADAGAVNVGLQVTVKDIERKRDATYRIVGSAEADPSAGRLSNESPVGRALMGRKKGETVEVSVPAGVLKLKIVNISRPGVSESRRLDHLPHRFADRTEIAEVRAAHGDLAAGDASGVRYRLAGRVMGRRLMGKAAFLDLEDRSGRMQLLASADGLGEELFAAVCDTQLGDVVGVAGEAISSRRGELTLRLEEFQLLAPCEQPAARPAPRPRRRRGALPPALRRPDGQRRTSREDAAAARAHDRGRPRVPRRRGLHRGRDADPAAALRRRERAPVHDASQRARPHVLPAHRHRAVPQAPDRRRPRARLRDRQGLPQRGRVVQAQPRVHDGRVVRGLRRLHATACAAPRSSPPRACAERSARR